MKLASVIVIIFTLLTPSKQALHMFQQNRYELKRYFDWLMDTISRNINLVVKYIAYFLVAFVLIFFKWNYVLLTYILLLSMFNFLKEAKEEYIKPLKLTFRVQRQIIVLLLLYIILLTLAYSNLSMLLIIALFAPFIPWFMIALMHLITLPIENIVQRHFLGEAMKMLDQHPNLKKIGITGSYGKTSSKNVVQEILSSEYYSLMTPASFNTPMGITKTIRESLKNTHETFVCEMGADKVGDIEFLTQFIKPQYGIVTSIGPQHLNTFESIDNIIVEKMRLVESLPSEGIAILNRDNEYIRNYEIQNNCQVIWYGIDHEADYQAVNINFSPQGSSFDLLYQGERYPFETVLLGKHNISNILAAIALGHSLGISFEKLQIAVHQVNYIEHRLEVKTINNRRFIDNAFNSNPSGAQMSLEVLSMMPGTRYIVTPGMIDLGSLEEEENYKFGQAMKGNVDYVVLVGEHQTQPIYQGLVDADFDKDKITTFATVKEALAYIYQVSDPKDTILLENDLPDAFNS